MRSPLLLAILLVPACFAFGGPAAAAISRTVAAVPLAVSTLEAADPLALALLAVALLSVLSGTTVLVLGAVPRLSRRAAVRKRS
jgi:hypothetical protein